nr:replication initiator protein A [Acidithiobacillus thiooxidans]
MLRSSSPPDQTTSLNYCLKSGVHYTLHEKSGSTATLREFRRLLKCLADSDELPSYRVMFNDDGDAITFYPKSGMRSAIAQVRDLLKRPRK